MQVSFDLFSGKVDNYHMKLVERGVLDTSDIYLYNGNSKTDSYFYHMLCCGHYYCNGQYRVRRNSLDSYLILYVVAGEGYIEDREGKRALSSGEMAILNCYERPSYGTEVGWEIKWVHFDGHEIGNLYRGMSRHIVHNPIQSVVDRAFDKIMLPFENDAQPTSAIVNKYITNLLTEFFESDREDILDSGRRFEKVYNYIGQNLDSKISLDELAEMSNLSRFYFIRAFKEETGYTPHEYIIHARVNSAVFFLSATSMTLSEITYRCGFSNESAFSNKFKEIMGITPLQFRKKSIQDVL